MKIPGFCRISRSWASMGVDLNCAQLLIRAQKNAARRSRAWLPSAGRVYTRNRPALISILRNAGYELSKDRTSASCLDPTTTYSEEFFGLLGATEESTAIDASGYEGAQVVPRYEPADTGELGRLFDLVLDGGTLEHVFDFPMGIRNAIQMVTANGLFISCTVANNFSGHGFYQFSPELFHRLLCKENGYAVECCLMWEEIQGSRFYQVPDPDSLESRIELTSRSGTYLFIQCKTNWKRVQGLRSAAERLCEALGSNLDRYTPSQWFGRITRSVLKKISILRSAIFLARDLPRQMLSGRSPLWKRNIAVGVSTKGIRLAS